MQLKEVLQYEDKFRYQLLSRLQSDCNYYLGNGNRNKKALWAADEKEQIKTMKNLWLSFSSEEKPEWLTKECLARDNLSCKRHVCFFEVV